MAVIDNLVGFWSLEEASGTRVDDQGNNDLTDNRSVASAAGVVGNAADFEAGSFQYLSITDNADLSVGDIAFSFAGFFKAESLNDGVILDKGDGTEYQLWLNSADRA